MRDQFKNILIGLFVLAAFAVITYMLLFLHPSTGDEAKKYHVLFSDLDKVNVGTRVTYGGKPVGEVVQIKEISDPNDPRKSIEGFVYLYEVTIAIDSKVAIYNTDQISVRTSGLLGEKSVAITPMPLQPGQILQPVNINEVLIANESGGVEETLKRFETLSGKLGAALDGINEIITKIKEQEIVENIGSAVKNVKEVSAKLNQPEKIQDILDNVQKFAQFIADSRPKLDRVMDNLETTTVSLNGQGTFGRLISNDDLYLRFNSIMSKAETVFDDINHYGLLFSSDKGWQRMRARRANLLSTLQCPQEFQNFFNDEINQIYTSLSRVNVVMQQTAGDCPFIGEDCEFRKVFADLLRRVKQMEENVQMYNQQLMDIETCKTELCR